MLMSGLFSVVRESHFDPEECCLVRRPAPRSRRPALDSTRTWRAGLVHRVHRQRAEVTLNG